MQKIKFLDYLNIVISLLIFLYITYQSEITYNGLRREYYLKYVLISGFILASFLLIFFLGKETKIKIYSICYSLVFSFYLLEAYFTYIFVYKTLSTKELINVNSKKIKILRQQYNKEFDTRSGYKVYKDELNKNKTSQSDVQVTLTTSNYLRDKLKILPLSGKSYAINIFCNENGYWPIFKLDRYGFKNKNEVWDQNKNYKIAIVGDSFTHGACVDIQFDISGRLNYYLKKNSKNFDTINLGQLGHGPLGAYASVVEYSENINLKKLIWIFNPGNDLIELELELKNKTLSKYFYNKNYTQDLIKKNQIKDREVDIKMKKYLHFYEKKFHLYPFVKLSNFRFAISNMFDILKLQKKSKSVSKKKYNFDNFDKIANNFKSYAEENNIKLIFVYLHLYDKKNMLDANSKNKIFNIIQKYTIDIIDIDEDFSNIDYKKFYPFRMNGHYNEAGYDYVARKIYDRIK